MVALLLAFISLLPSRPHCDMIELNHHVHCGQVVWSQVIFWDWYPEEATYHVRGCYVLYGDDWPEPIRGGWRARGMEAAIFKETTSIVDPEAADRRRR